MINIQQYFPRILLSWGASNILQQFAEVWFPEQAGICNWWLFLHVDISAEGKCLASLNSRGKKFYSLITRSVKNHLLLSVFNSSAASFIRYLLVLKTDSEQTLPIYVPFATDHFTELYHTFFSRCFYRKEFTLFLLHNFFLLLSYLLFHNTSIMFWNCLIFISNCLKK